MPKVKLNQEHPGILYAKSDDPVGNARVGKIFYKRM
jgi:hypothetical protein